MSKLIPTDFIEDLLSKTDIAEVIGSRISLTRKGSEYSGLCPFHDEKTPSFSASTRKQFYFCFGCKESGNSINFVMKYEGVQFRDAVEMLADQAGMELPASEPTGAEKSNMAISSVLERSEQAYVDGVNDEESVSKFLDECGISCSTRNRYTLGYASDSAVNIVHGLPEDKVVEAGLAVRSRSKLKHWASNKLILAVRDRRGSVHGFISQPMNATKPTASSSTPLFAHEHDLYGLHEAYDVTRQTDTLVIVERPLEVLALHSYGVQCAVSTINTAISKKTLESLFKIVSNVVFCYSSTRIRGDEFDTTLKHSLGALKEGRDISFAILPGKARNCAAFLKTSGSDSFHSLVDNAIPAVDILYKKLSATRTLSGSDKEEWVLREGLLALTTVPSSLYRRLSIRHFEALNDASQKNIVSSPLI